jgi:DNA-binding LacI/PurR family transcriptional regulator
VPHSRQGQAGATLTLKDVARLAGVSTATASMALADSPRISTETKKSVRRAAEQLHYVPNWLGRGLRGRRLGAIGLIIPSHSTAIFAHPYFSEIIEGVSEVASEEDMTLVLSTATVSDGDSAYLRVFRERRVDGVVVAAATISDRNVDRLVADGHPVVVLGRYPSNPAVCAVGVNDHAGAYEATKHLIESHGAARIAHVSLDLTGLAGLDRLSGYRDALVEHGVTFDKELVIEGDATPEGGREAAERLLRRGGFDALFAGNDEMAVGALQALRANGRRIPEDARDVGFDDLQLAGLIDPALTTVRQPMRESGRLAAKRLVELLSQKSLEPVQLELPTELVLRRSCGCNGHITQ